MGTDKSNMPKDKHAIAKKLQSYGNKRKTSKEQYYTKAETVDTCLEKIKHLFNKDTLFLEPAGGTGEFIEGLRRCSIPDERIISFDIEPKHQMVKEGNFLEITDLPANLLTISNPPFGRCNSLSKKFFNHAAKYSETICFLVPKSWRKWSVHNSLDLNFHLILDEELGKECFYTEDNSLKNAKVLSTIFQVWQRKDVKREKIKIEDRGYLTRSTPEKGDVAIVLFGYGCGRIEEDFERVKNTTKGFFKVSNPNVITALKSVDYSQFYENTAYVRALSVKEINYLLNEFFDKQTTGKNNGIRNDNS